MRSKSNEILSILDTFQTNPLSQNPLLLKKYSERLSSNIFSNELPSKTKSRFDLISPGLRDVGIEIELLKKSKGYLERCSHNIKTSKNQEKAPESRELKAQEEKKGAVGGEIGKHFSVKDKFFALEKRPIIQSPLEKKSMIQRTNKFLNISSKANLMESKIQKSTFVPEKRVQDSSKLENFGKMSSHLFVTPRKRELSQPFEKVGVLNRGQFNLLMTMKGKGKGEEERLEKSQKSRNYSLAQFKSFGEVSSTPLNSKKINYTPVNRSINNSRTNFLSGYRNSNPILSPSVIPKNNQ